METKNSNHEDEKWCINESLYPFHGFWFNLTYLKSTERILHHFTPFPEDVILASFPKTGTTWLKALLHSTIHNPNSLISTHPHHLVPSLETCLYLHGQPQGSPQHAGIRVLGTHLPYQIIGDALGSSTCKVVYVTRNPKDALVSLWNFIKATPASEEDPWELETAVDQFCRGVVPFGPYYEHVLRYREESLKTPRKVLFVTFEELKEDPEQHVGRLAEFLGLGGSLSTSEEIVHMCSFEKLSNQEVNKSGDFPDGFPFPYNSFFRKGEVGDHKNHLTPDMIDRIDTVTREKFHGAGFVYGI